MIFLSGGYSTRQHNDTYEINLRTGEIETRETMLVSRWGHANYAIMGDDTIYTFGGNGVLKSAEIRKDGEVKML